MKFLVKNRNMNVFQGKREEQQSISLGSWSISLALGTSVGTLQKEGLEGKAEKSSFLKGLLRSWEHKQSYFYSQVTV